MPDDTAVPTSLDVEWEKRARSVERDRLELLKASAAKWRDALGSTVAVIAAAAAIGAPYLGGALPTGIGKSAVIVLLGGSLVLLIVCSWLTMRTALGVPIHLDGGGTAYRSWYEREFQNDVRRMKASRVLMLLSFLALTVAASIGLAVAGPARDVYAVTTTAGASWCGTLAPSAGGDEIAVIASDGRLIKIPVTDLKTILKSDGC